MLGDNYLGFDISEMLEIGMLDAQSPVDHIKALGVPHAAYYDFSNMLTDLKNEYPHKLFTIPRQKIMYRTVSYSVKPTTVTMHGYNCGLTFGPPMRLEKLKRFLGGLLSTYHKVAIFSFEYSVHIDGTTFDVYYKWKPIYARI